MESKKSTVSIFRNLYFWGIVLSVLMFLTVNKVVGLSLDLLTLILWHKKNLKTKHMIDSEAIKKEARDYLEKAKQEGRLPVTQSSALLDPGENAYLTENTVLSETRAVRQTTGRFASTRIFGSMRYGAVASRSESHQEWRVIDSGKLILTNKSFIFLGNKEKRNLPLKKILAVETYANAIEVSSDTRSKSLRLPVRNPYIWTSAIQILRSTDGNGSMSNASIRIE